MLAVEVECHNNGVAAVEAWEIDGVLYTKYKIEQSGTTIWGRNKVVHRMDGPAVIHSKKDGRAPEYWVNGNQISKHEFDFFYGYGNC